MAGLSPTINWPSSLRGEGETESSVQTERARTSAASVVELKVLLEGDGKALRLSCCHPVVAAEDKGFSNIASPPMAPVQFKNRIKPAHILSSSLGLLKQKIRHKAGKVYAKACEVVRQSWRIFIRFFAV
jgi:hypothetical protein